MKSSVIGCLMLVVALAVSCRKQDIRTATIFVPGLRTTACADYVVRALGVDQGVSPDEIKIDLSTRTLHVEYDSVRHSLKNLEFTIADAGFDANEVPANEKARAALPPECR